MPLLIINPEYIKEDDNVDSLLNKLRLICDNEQDEVSFKLLSGAYEFSGNKKLATEYTNYYNIIDQQQNIEYLNNFDKDVSDEVLAMGDENNSELI